MSNIGGEELENSILGCIIKNPEVFDKVCSYFPTDEVFYQNRAKLLWNRIKQMKKNNEHIDLMTVCTGIDKSDATSGLTPLYKYSQ